MTEKVTAGRDQLGEIAPQFAGFNDDILFGEVWAREKELAPRERSIVTVTALITGGNFEQLPFHISKAIQNGVTKGELVEIITQLGFYAGWPKAWSAFNIAKKIFDE